MTTDTNNSAAPSQEELQAEWDAVAADREAGNLKPEVPEQDSTNDGQTEETAAAEQPQPSSQAADPLAERFAKQDKRLEELLSELKRTNGRVASLQSELAKAGTAAAAATEGGPTKAQVAAAVQDPEEWKQLQEDFPEWAVAMDKRLDQKIAAASKASAPATPALDPSAVDQTVNQRVEEQVAALEASRVERRHKGWVSIVRSTEFKEWIAKQPAEVQALSNSRLSDDAIDLLDRFQKSTTQKVSTLQDARQRRLQGSAVSKPGAAAPPAKSTDDMTPNELWQHEAALRAERKQRQSA